MKQISKGLKDKKEDSKQKYHQGTNSNNFFETMDTKFHKNSSGTAIRIPIPDRDTRRASITPEITDSRIALTQSKNNKAPCPGYFRMNVQFSEKHSGFRKAQVISII